MELIVIIGIIAVIFLFTFLIVRVWINNSSDSPTPNPPTPNPPTPNPMILNISVTSLSDATFELPLTFTGDESVDVDWGDNGPVQKYSASSGIITRLYTSTNNNIIISITGSATRFGKVNYTGANLLTKVASWGDLGLKSLEYAFYTAENLIEVPDHIPSTVTSLKGAFNGAISFNQNINTWNTLNVIDMSEMFFNAINFNQPLNNWDVRNVTDMNTMFTQAYIFNQDINNWITSSVTNMSNMFYNTTTFNTDISGWDTSNVINMAAMFYNSIYDKDLSGWNVDKVETAEDIFNANPILPNTSYYPPFTNGLPAPGDPYYGSP
jgi:surface protein